MIPEDVLKIVAEKLENCGIAYMIVGSFASNIHGKPRTTHDADMVIEIDEPSLEKFVQALGNDFYFDVEAARDAIRSNFMCNALHYDTGFKIDFFIRKNKAFALSEFERREINDLLGHPCWFATAEDTILAKLEWSKMGESERQFNDAVNIAKVQGANLDFTYLQRWAVDLHVENLLNRLLEEIKPIE
ncbi:hypothetical protein L0337_16395 [candidate division KSB1 bacterium]|nr:hypothetical protein [candidate division KSB1 bacterium]